MDSKTLTKFRNIIDEATDVVIMQADNPDGDSLASALALESILGAIGKEPHLYCGVDIPTYLRHLPGWDRVTSDLPRKIDATIIVDTSAISLFENLSKSPDYARIKNAPGIVIDHHAAELSVPFATVNINNPSAVATGEVIYEIARALNWPLDSVTRDMIAVSIMSDSLGLVSQGTTARSIHIIAELVEAGVDLAALDNARKELSRKTPELLQYKGQLLQRLEYYGDNRICTVTIPWEEIVKYSPLYNPSMLVIDEMRYSEGTNIAIAFKAYADGKVTAKIRSNYGITIANTLAEHFGGGGHPYASGFKDTSGKPLEDIKAECIAKAIELLDTLQVQKL